MPQWETHVVEEKSRELWIRGNNMHKSHIYISSRPMRAAWCEFDWNEIDIWFILPLRLDLLNYVLSLCLHTNLQQRVSIRPDGSWTMRLEFKIFGIVFSSFFCLPIIVMNIPFFSLKPFTCSMYPLFRVLFNMDLIEEFLLHTRKNAAHSDRERGKSSIGMWRTAEREQRFFHSISTFSSLPKSSKLPPNPQWNGRVWNENSENIFANWKIGNDWFSLQLPHSSPSAECAACTETREWLWNGNKNYIHPLTRGRSAIFHPVRVLDGESSRYSWDVRVVCGGNRSQICAVRYWN